ncbi:hypothetical protein GCM10009559_15680 [Pseudonocardia zijingensis]|jgi:hypothetical protein|uniref:Uncharacterized protein n=1 Tax=Pseudonocardia zijingensis TaxID=153376 RepID=A0ABN1PJE1_9PSEU
MAPARPTEVWGPALLFCPGDRPEVSREGEVSARRSAWDGGISGRWDCVKAAVARLSC